MASLCCYDRARAPARDISLLINEPFVTVSPPHTPKTEIITPLLPVAGRTKYDELILGRIDVFFVCIAL